MRDVRNLVIFEEIWDIKNRISSRFWQESGGCNLTTETSYLEGILKLRNLKFFKNPSTSYGVFKINSLYVDLCTSLGVAATLRKKAWKLRVFFYATTLKKNALCMRPCGAPSIAVAYVLYLNLQKLLFIRQNSILEILNFRILYSVSTLVLSCSFY